MLHTNRFLYVEEPYNRADCDGQLSLASPGLEITVRCMSTAELRRLPRAEKLRLLEDLWVDLTAEGDDVSSPPWHEVALGKTEAEFTAGRVEILDLETAWSELHAASR